mmetsp:Transcript_15747/g.19097  ORF Transcript_15747/g.19097 Transcript_15747/m.19097 type:complete len:225 (+) Transcript_15747:66-740(+)
METNSEEEIVKTIEDEVKILQRLLYRNFSQHRRTKHYQFSKGAQKTVSKWLVLGRNGSTAVTKQIETGEKACLMLQRAGLEFSRILKQNFFVTLALSFLALLANIRELMLLWLKKKQGSKKKYDLVGEKIDRDHFRKGNQVANVLSCRKEVEIQQESKSETQKEKVPSAYAVPVEAGPTSSVDINVNNKRSLKKRQLTTKSQKTKKKKKRKKKTDAIDSIFDAL